MTKKRASFWEDGKAGGQLSFQKTLQSLEWVCGRSRPLTEVWCVKPVPCNAAKPKLTHVVNKNLKVLWSSFLECFPLQHKRVIVSILNGIMGTLWWIHENYGLWNVTFILRFLRELLVAFHFWPLHEVCSRHQRIFVVSKISMFWIPWDGMNMSHVKWLVVPCCEQINTRCFYSLQSEL